MAFALHARMLTETNLKRHAEEAMEQARLSEAARRIGLREKVEVYGPRMQATFAGSPDGIASLVRNSADLGVSFEQIGAVEGKEHDELSKRLAGLADVRSC